MAVAPLMWHLDCYVEGKMVWLALILMAVWLLGVVTAYTLGGFIHILLVLSLAILLIQFTMGQREA
jgi:hypothetical protein